MVLVAGAAILGALIGSFANVLIYRVPRRESIAFPASHCPQCNHEIRKRHNIPIVGWLILRGRCADCGARISPRYPLVEAIMAAAFGAIVWHWGLTWVSVLLLVFAVFTVVLAAIDFDVQRLPNPLVGTLAFATAVLLLVISWVYDDWEGLLRSLIAAAAIGLLYFVALVIYPKGLGFGDVKLAPVLGAIMGGFGWGAFAVGTFAGFLWGGVVGIGAMVVTRRTKNVRIPFGPWMLAGAWTGIVFGNAIWDWYLYDLMGL